MTKHLTKKQLRRVLKNCTTFTVNGYEYDVVGTYVFDLPDDVALEGTRTKTDLVRPYVIFTVGHLLDAAVSECESDALRMPKSQDLVKFYSTNQIKLQ